MTEKEQAIHEPKLKVFEGGKLIYGLRPETTFSKWKTLLSKEKRFDWFLAGVIIIVSNIIFFVIGFVAAKIL